LQEEQMDNTSVTPIAAGAYDATLHERARATTFQDAWHLLGGIWWRRQSTNTVCREQWLSVVESLLIADDLNAREEGTTSDGRPGPRTPGGTR
jgi:hypothetical protein